MAPDRREDPFQVALRRAILRAEEARRAVPEIPPGVRFELRRKALHVLVAVVAVPVVLLLPLAFAVAVASAGVVVISVTWIVERRRLQHLLPPAYKDLVHTPAADALEKTRRPGEDYPWSPVLYTAALIIIALAHQLLGLSWAIAFAAFAILGLGDAASALVGVAYGRRRLPWNARKSLEGTIAGAVAGLLAGVVMASVAFAFVGLSMPPLFLVVILVGAIAGALAETLPGVEDNFVVPLAAAATMFVVARVLAIPLP